MTVEQVTTDQVADDGVRGRVRPPAGRRRSRRAEILEIAVGLFVTRGYHGVSMDEIGAAAGVTGPALYHHFARKEAMLAAALYPVSESLLAGGRARMAEHASDPAAALTALVDFHVDFALANPAVIALHLHELDRLPEEPRREIRRLQRLYVEVWVDALTALRAELAAGRGARAGARGVRSHELDPVPVRRGRPGAQCRPAARGDVGRVAGSSRRLRARMSQAYRDAGSCGQRHGSSQPVDNPVDFGPDRVERAVQSPVRS